MSTKKPSRGDALWPWYLATATYVGFGALVLYGRWEEVGSLLTPPKAPPDRLPLNSIGDVLAGFFAPLAFLWLFVATQLQRRELRLQREELADTREVLAKQQQELQKSAEESNRQTDIMQRTLNVTGVQIVYSEFNLHLYFIAKNLLILNQREFFITGDVVGSYRVDFMRYKNTVNPNDSSTVDDFLYYVNEQLVGLLMEIDRNTTVNLNQGNYIIFNTLNSVASELSDLVEEADYSGNQIVYARIKGARLDVLLKHLRLIVKKFVEHDSGAGKT